MKATKISVLKAGAAPLVLGLALISLPVVAQEVSTAPQANGDQGTPIIVTGTILRRTDFETPSPITVVTAENLDRRGISTIQEGVQRLAANNGPALTNSFSANGAFAGGASGVSLRGLSTNSTLVLFDGMRAAYYPLADDGTRNFVDLNTIPDDIVEDIQVLRDGAASSYGADAIAGVVNIITKKNIQGLSARAEAGISSRGDASQYRLSATYGVGDLNTNGVNAYISGFYYNSALLKNNQRLGVYGSADLRSLCTDGVCGANYVVNGLQSDGYTAGFQQATPFAVRARDPLTGGAVEALGDLSTRYQLLTNCGGLPSYNPTAEELSLPQNASAPSTVCQEDVSALYGIINPDIERFGGSARVTARVGDSGEAYAAFNFLQSRVAYDGLPATIRATAPATFYYPGYSTATNVLAYGNNTVLQLPVYVCAARANCDTAADRQLNPNNPFAEQGYTAAILGRIPNLIEHDETRTRAYRGAVGYRGDITDKINLAFDATAMHVDLRSTATGYVYIQHLLDVIADGSFNFLDPTQNSQQIMDYLAPGKITDSSSDLIHAQAVLSGSPIDLPGGPLQVGLGGAIRYEAIDAPSANTDFFGPKQRYFGLNGFAAKGSRTVYSAFAEITAPILDQLEVNASGRYDKYSSGPDNFSPKVGVKFKPIEQVLLRGTYARGFRIPSFGEANATFPTTAYVAATPANYTDSFLQQYGCSFETYQSCPAYVWAAGYGQTSIFNPDLKPEKSRSFTAGIMFEPARNVSISVDYYNIKKTNAITTANYAPAILAYYSGQTIPQGYGIVADAADPSFPDALPRIAFVQAPFVNANTIKSAGLDFGINATFNLADDLIWQTQAEASYILELSTTYPDGTKERYEGTLGNFNMTAGSGTPKWKGTWLNSLSYKAVTVNVTLNYFSGYNFSAEDQEGPGARGKCGIASGALGCDVSDYLTVDLGGSVKLNDDFTFYFMVQNLLDDLPPYDDVTYGAHLYNPVQGGEGILGRYFKAGVKVGF